MSAERPHHVWGIAITYVRLQGSWMYLVAVLDWYSRFVVSWAVDETLEMPFVLETVRSALTQARPVIWNSDQGSHFTSPQYTQVLQAAGVQISMDGKGRALDNIFTERLWRTVKSSTCICGRTACRGRCGRDGWCISTSIPSDGRIRRWSIGRRRTCMAGAVAN